MHIRLLIGLAVFWIGGTAVADEPKDGVKLPDGITRQSAVEGITEYKLTNGLRVILLPDASRPKVTVNCTILAGSRHEGYGEAGMAHLLEHMAFKTCKKFPEVTKASATTGRTSTAPLGTTGPTTSKRCQRTTITLSSASNWKPIGW